MKVQFEFIESRANDPVLREMARLANLILNDRQITKREQADLIRRLESEYHAYKAWNKQYASYFRTPRARQPNKGGAL